MKEISRELWEDVKHFCDKSIQEEYSDELGVQMNWKRIEKKMQKVGIKIIEPDYLARARDCVKYAEKSNIDITRADYLFNATKNYEKHIKQLEERDNGR
jgi:hypothetical protein